MHVVPVIVWYIPVWEKCISECSVLVTCTLSNIGHSLSFVACKYLTQSLFLNPEAYYICLTGCTFGNCTLKYTCTGTCTTFYMQVIVFDEVCYYKGS